jgi:plastocyanin
VIRKHPAIVAVAVAALVAAFALAACGGDDDDDTTAASETTAEATTEDQASSGGGETIPVAESDYKLDPADPTAKAGEITFELSNDGEAPHNLEVEGNGVEEVSETIQPGDSTSFTVELEAGTYEIYCAIDGHKELGMEGELTVN